MKKSNPQSEDWGGRLKLWINDNTRPLKGLSVMERDGKVILFYQPKNGNTHTLSLADSDDGFNFNRLKHQGKLFCSHGNPEDINTLDDVRLSKLDDKYIALFKKHQEAHIYSATSTGLNNWRECRHEIYLDTSGLIVPDFRFDDKYLMYLGGESIYSAYSENGTKWQKKEIATLSRSDGISYGIEHVSKNDAGIQVYFHRKKKIGKNSYYSIGMVVYDFNNPERIVWRSHEPIWEETSAWQGQIKTPLGAVQIGHKLIGYWQLRNGGIYATVYTLFDSDFRFTTRKITAKLDRIEHNPIISPNAENPWEAFNTFNPAAIYLENQVHLVYRAQGLDYVSVLGHATLENGHHVISRSIEPVFSPHKDFTPLEAHDSSQVVHQYVSGGGYGGCEDPRLTMIDDKIYMTYVSFDGVNPPRVALTSIAVSDFLNQRWAWETPVLISPPNIVDKNAVIFPEKINGKYAIAHRIYPNILIDFVDSLDFDGNTWLNGDNIISPRRDYWDSKKIGAGAPPIKTKDGWLLIYQAVGYQDSSKYKIGAMLLDLKDPTKVLYRSRYPILEPDAIYENEGFKAGVVYPCGAVDIDGTLFVYYGGADSYVCVATANLEKFVMELKHFELPRLEPAVIRKVM